MKRPTAARFILLAILGTAICLPPRAAFAEPPAGPPECALDALIAQPGFWETSPDTFGQRSAAAAFRWTSNTRESARSVYPNLTFTGMRVVEALLWFDTNKVREVTLSLYNRGDEGSITAAALDGLVGAAVTNLDKLAAVKPVSRDIRGAGKLPKKLMVWTAASLVYTLEWSGSVRDKGYQAEYLRLRIQPPQKQATLAGGTQAVSGLAMNKKTIERTPAGDVYLKDVPMVDQGPKGYCAVAATERVLRYFGTSVDQHQIAQMANTQQGTDPESLKAALTRISRGLQIKLTEIQELSVKDFIKMVDEYSATARRRKVPEITLPTSGVIDMGQVFAGMKPEIFRESRLKNPAALNRFHEKVVQTVNKRIPVLWSVMLGIVPEPAIPQASGGHVRLIIGYNDKTKEILYSDTWGAGHELKRMALPDAYAITMGLFSIEPR